MTTSYQISLIMIKCFGQKQASNTSRRKQPRKSENIRRSEKSDIGQKMRCLTSKE